MGVESVAATSVALNQAQVQMALAVRMVQIARETGTSQQALQLVQQAAETVAELPMGSVSAAGRLDTYA